MHHSWSLAHSEYTSKRLSTNCIFIVIIVPFRRDGFLFLIHLKLRSSVYRLWKFRMKKSIPLAVIKMILFVRCYYLSLTSSFYVNSLYGLNLNSSIMLATCKYCAELLPLNSHSKQKWSKKTNKNSRTKMVVVYVCAGGSVHIWVYVFKV